MKKFIFLYITIKFLLRAGAITNNKGLFGPFYLFNSARRTDGLVERHLQRLPCGQMNDYTS